jgi:5-methylcytosine-specific restriction protein A
MTLKPCIVCGEPSAASRCPEHTAKPAASPTERGYDWQWTKLSRRARKLQPWCSGCGATEDLQADHSPEAWARKAAGLSVRLRDVQVLCGGCNRAAGAARGSSDTRGVAPRGTHPDSTVRQNVSYSLGVGILGCGDPQPSERREVLRADTVQLQDTAVQDCVRGVLVFDVSAAAGDCDNDSHGRIVS